MQQENRAAEPRLKTLENPKKKKRLTNSVKGFPALSFLLYIFI